MKTNNGQLTEEMMSDMQKYVENQPERTAAKLEAEIVDDKKARKEEKFKQKQAEKQRAKEEKFWNGMVTRKEAKGLVETLSRQSSEQVFEALREPVSTNIIANMALVEILVEKGIFTEEEYQQKFAEIASRQAQAKGDSNDEEAGTESGEAKEETQE
ncbi:hypothetical protein [Bacillus paranthracis]|uniref:hypothetical protein n=1 Tax=Bacillus paranthracis TaxID=2026186 RepID=UPI0022E5D223|nr:hypothetical protein [Bacillus paranthracis]